MHKFFLKAKGINEIGPWFLIHNEVEGFVIKGYLRPTTELYEKFEEGAEFSVPAIVAGAIKWKA